MDQLFLALLKYAWKKKFLDFTVLMTNFGRNKLIKPFSLLYHLNPFNNIVHKKEFYKGMEIFPEKLNDAYDYPLYITGDTKYSDNFVYIIKRLN